MTVLTSSAIQTKAIVQGAVPAGERPTTYDATVGSMIRCGVEIEEASYDLPPRHILWVVSAEIFNMGDSVTGIATLKTSLTHQGLLALNVGVVDPGWNAPLATAVVNLSNSPIKIKKGAPFFRVLFQTHAKIPAAQLDVKTISMSDYVRSAVGFSRSFSPTFLDMEDLSRTVADRVLGMPRLGLKLSIAALVLALLAIAIPVGVAVAFDTFADKAKLAQLEMRVSSLEPRKANQIDKSACKAVKIGGAVHWLCP